MGRKTKDQTRGEGFTKEQRRQINSWTTLGARVGEPRDLYICPGCNKGKSLEKDFNKCAGRPNGHQGLCRECHNKKVAEWKARRRKAANSARADAVLKAERPKRPKSIVKISPPKAAKKRPAGVVSGELTPERSKKTAEKLVESIKKTQKGDDFVQKASRFAPKPSKKNAVLENPGAASVEDIAEYLDSL